MTEFWKLSAAETARLVRSGEVKAADVAASAIERMEAANPAINAITVPTGDEAMKAAEAVDAMVKAGRDPGPLAGVPVTIKENVDQAGHATTNGLRIQKDLIAEEDNPVVANLRRAGALFIGRTNTPAFSLRWFTRNSLFGATKNPHNHALTPGGSSGGAAAATAAGIGAMGHGTDIAGSVRYPAYACGLQGLRPTQGRVPAWNPSSPDRHIGAQLMAVSGPHARSVEDLRLSLEVMAAPAAGDPGYVPAPLTGEPAPKRAALCLAPDGMEPTPPVERAVRAAAERLADAGWEITETESPPLREPAKLQLTLWLAEMRIGGGAAVAREADPDAVHVFTEMQKICPEPGLEELMNVLQRRLGFMRIWQDFLTRFPVLICPVSAEPPFPDQLDREDFTRVFAAQLVQVGLPLMGLPALSVFTGMESLDAGPTPLGAQLIGPRFREDILLSAAAEIEARSPAVRVAGA